MEYDSEGYRVYDKSAEIDQHAENVQEMLCKMIEQEVKDADRPETEIIAIWHEAVQNVMLGLIASKKMGRLSL